MRFLANLYFSIFLSFLQVFLSYKYAFNKSLNIQLLYSACIIYIRNTEWSRIILMLWAAYSKSLCVRIYILKSMKFHYFYKMSKMIYHTHTIVVKIALRRALHSKYNWSLGTEVIISKVHNYSETNFLI